MNDKGLFFFFQLPSVNRVLRLQQDHLSNQANPDLQKESVPSLQTAPLLEMHPDSPIPIQCLDSYLRAIDKKLKLLSDATMVVGTMKDMETESAGTITIREIFKGGRAPPIFGKTKTSAFSTDAQSRFSSVVLGGVLGGTLRLTGSLNLSSCGSNARGE